jgi:hypothetical protein
MTNELAPLGFRAPHVKFSRARLRGRAARRFAPSGGQNATSPPFEDAQARKFALEGTRSGYAFPDSLETA